MSFKESLIQSTKSDASAYMQFVSGHKREGFYTYAFVEDDDDMVFYQHALIDLNNTCFLSCGGKENVLKVFRKLSSDGNSDGLLFFVDRDTELAPYEAADEVCRTTLYSWENYVCQIRAMASIAGRRFRPTLTQAEREWVKAGWISTVKNFSEELEWHTSLTHLSNHGEKSLGMRDVTLVKDATVDDSEIKPSNSVKGTLDLKEKLALSYGVEKIEIDRVKQLYYGINLLEMSRGKTIFQIFRVYMSMVEKVLGKLFYGQYNSPLTLLSYIPSNDTIFDFIRVYVIQRLGTLSPTARTY